jgi:SAM-dependent methyltransferase
MDLKSTYNTIVEDWFKDHHDDTWWHEGTEKFMALLSPEATILDVGCGPGVKSRWLTKKGFKVTGIDFSEKSIELAKRESQSMAIDFEVIDMYDLDSYPKTYDAVFAQASLLHIPKKRVVEVLEKLNRKIKSGGLLYIAVKGIRADGVEEQTLRENDYGHEYERFFSYYSLPELEKYFKNLNFEVVLTTSNVVGKTEWLQIVGKKK